MTTFFLVRHGETSWNADGRFQGQQESPLNEVGYLQAHAVSTALASVALDAVYTSDLSRAVETARVIADRHHLPLHRESRLREVHFGAWEGLTLPEVTARWPEELAAWRDDSLHHRPPGGEVLEAVYRRVSAVILEITQQFPDGAIVLVGHGGSLRAAIVLALGTDMAAYRRVRLDNCSLTRIRYRNHHFTLDYLNDTCHLRYTQGAPDPRPSPVPQVP